MIKSLFIANRGEIAMRIVRACKEMGIRSVIGYSKADEYSMPVRMADEKVCIGAAPSSESYLGIENIISAASVYECEAIHPGVGFLSERGEFARRVLDAGIEFVGPRPDSIHLLGDKVAAKKAAITANVPVVPGTPDAVRNISEAKAFAKEYGYPVIIKAAGGGGGKGIRIIRAEKEMEAGFNITTIEAEKSFGDGRVYIEKFLTHPRHVEIQLLADKHGNVIHLGERDCTVQFRHQKLIEESPSPAIDQTIREKMGVAAVHLLQNIKYENAATVEYLLDGDKFYFMEVNSRIQVEHPVTELVTGIDLIKEQIRVVSGESLSVTQEEVCVSGYAMECRINAITPGKIDYMNIPNGIGVRVDSWISQGDVIPPYYDSLLLKLLVYAKNRNEGIARMLRALDELVLEGKGFSYNKQWHKNILNHTQFRSGKYTIQFLEESGLIDSIK